MRMSPRAYTLAATALGSSLAFIDATAVLVALPTIQKALNLGLAGEQWIFLAYSLALAALYLVGGALGDRWGHRTVFSRGVVGFALASLLAGLAPSGAWLIAARVLQGISGAFVTTNSLAWLRSVYAEQAGRAVGLWTSLTGISTIIAPPLGGALTQWLSWRWIFYINLPLAALVVFWTKRAVPDTLDHSQRRPLDLLGSGLIALSFGFLTYFLVQGAKIGFAHLLWALVIGLAGLVTFIIVERRLSYPLLPFKLFRVRNFLVANLETLFIYGALNGILVYFTLYLQFLGLTPLSSSLFLVPVSIVLIALAAYFGGLADRLGPRKLLTAGPVLIGSGALLFSLITTKPMIWLRGGLGLTFFSLGLAMLVAPITALALKSVEGRHAGLAAGINNTVSRLGGLIAVALVGLIISVSFFSHLPDKHQVPLGLHPPTPAVAAASVHGYQLGMWLVVGLSYGAALIGWFGVKPLPVAREPKHAAG